MKIAGIEFQVYDNMEDMICEDFDNLISVLRDLMPALDKMKAPETEDDMETVANLLIPIATGDNARKICASILYVDGMDWQAKYKALAKMKTKERTAVLDNFFKFLVSLQKSQSPDTGENKQSTPS